VKAFLLWIGAYNAFGSLVVLLCLRQTTGDTVLRRVLQMLAVPYDHGAHGPLWIWWAATSNFALGAIMVLASRWSDVGAQRDVTAAVVGAYVAMLIVAVAAVRSPRYRLSGLVSCYVLWLLQIGWGVHAWFSG